MTPPSRGRAGVPVTERTERFQRVYEVCAQFEINCFVEAAQMLDRLTFARALVASGVLNEGEL